MNTIKHYRVFPLTVLVCLFLRSTSYAISSASYILANFRLNVSGGIDMSSTNNKATVTIGENILAISKSKLYVSLPGLISQIKSTSADFAADDLNSVHVYPNPYKPASGGIYDASFLTFRNLTSRATIRIFNIAGERVATLEKDSTANEYQWAPKNDAGNAISSGLYIYYITAPNGKTTKGKFAIIR